MDLTYLAVTIVLTLGAVGRAAYTARRDPEVDMFRTEMRWRFVFLLLTWNVERARRLSETARPRRPPLPPKPAAE